MDFTSDKPSAILFLYDQGGHILCLTGARKPYDTDSAVGLPAWYAMNEADAQRCKAAIMTCLASGEPQTFDVAVDHIGWWRITLFPCRVGKVRIFGVAMKIPESVLDLTERQREVCRLLAEGLGSKQIGARLGVARETIDNHRSAISRRIGIRPASLVAWCGEHRHWL